MDPGQEATIWMARAATVAYLAALVLIRKHQMAPARALWTAGFGIYALHVMSAFAFFYEWSHFVAQRETARQTAELFGVNWGGGIYVNYAFTAVWFIDCLWWWTKPDGYRRRPAAVSASVHLFLAFVFLNATLVVWLLRAFSRG